MFTVTVQELLAGIVPPVGLPKINVVAPAVGAQVGVPLQVVDALGVEAASSPVGRVSVNLTPVNGKLFELVKVKVNVEVELSAMGFGEKDLVRLG